MKRTLLGTSLWIDQTPNQAFNLDTLLLADFIQVPYRFKQIADFGTGAGALMLSLSQKTKAKIIGLEIQSERYEKALENIRLNQLENQLKVIHQDVKHHTLLNLDMVVGNPPFFKVTQKGHLNQDWDETIARHEVLLDLPTFIHAAKRALKYGGHLYFIHRPDRLGEIVETLNRYQFQVKRIRFVHPYGNKPANHVLIFAIKDAQPGVIIDPPFILYEKPHVLSQEMEEVYGGRSYVVKPVESKRKT